MNDVDIDYKAAGRVSGFVMTKVGNYRQEAARPVIENVTIGQCAQRGCKARDGIQFQFGFNANKLSGTWRLTVVADGAPVTTTIRLKNVAGSMSAVPRTTGAAEIRTLKPTVSGDPGNMVFSAGSFTRMKRSNFGMVGLWVIGDPHVATAYGSCMYERRPPWPEEAAFTPGCPVSDNYNSMTLGSGGRGGIVLTSATLNRSDGLGAWYSTASSVKRYGAVALWLDLRA